jgi:hypothetical protein
MNGYRPRTTAINGKNTDNQADTHCVCNRWLKYFCQLLNTHGFYGVRQTEIRIAEPLVPEPRADDVQMAMERLNRRRSPGIDHIAAELTKAGRRKISFEFHKLIKSVLEYGGIA